MKRAMHFFIAAILAAAALVAVPAPALAQAAPGAQSTAASPVCGYWQNGTWVNTGACAHNPYCGAYVNGVWVENGNCPDVRGYIPRRAFVTGTITKVAGHLVTVQQTRGAVVINDQPALNRQTTGKVAVGRAITALGFWRNGTFFATRIR